MTASGTANTVDSARGLIAIQTHLVLASGKLVLQKKEWAKCFKRRVFRLGLASYKREDYGSWHFSSSGEKAFNLKRTDPDWYRPWMGQLA